MASYTESRVIRADPETVYAFRRDFTNLPRYNPDVVELTVGEAGTTYTFKIRMGPVRIPVTLHVSTDEAPGHLVCEMDTFMPAVEECRFEAHPDGTLLTFRTEVDSRGGPLRPLVDRLLVVPTGLRQVRRELDLMAELLQDPSAGSGSGSASMRP